MSVLLIEDDREIAHDIVTALTARGLPVAHMTEGAGGLTEALKGTHDVLITDRMLPGLDGLEIIKHLRAAGLQTPVLVLSALESVDERVRGLQAGGDDYLGKPFSMEELIARVESLARRALQAPKTRLNVADLELDLLNRTAKRGGRVLELTSREFRLLEVLARHAGQVVTRAMLLETVWNLHFDPETNIVDVHISRLSQTVDRDFDQPLIHTVRGAGYSMSA